MPEYQMWISDETGDVRCPSGESRNIFKQRVIYAFACIENMLMKSCFEKKSAIVSCHGGVIVCIMDYLFPDMKNFYEWQPESGRGYMIYYENEKVKKYEPL
jgi:alpha-ribazole phosphatase